MRLVIIICGWYNILNYGRFATAPCGHGFRCWAAVRDDIAAVVEASAGKCVKVIIETCFLNKEQIRLACLAAADAGAQYVKTSTGMAAGGATEENVRLMKQTVTGRCLVKAAGGIRTLEDCKRMLRAGADRIGTGSAAAIAEEA